jgi:hypothetical protein
VPLPLTSALHAAFINPPGRIILTEGCGWWC